MKTLDAAMQIEGMTTYSGLAIMDVFLGRALSASDAKLCFEFGTYKGRTAALILGRLKEGGHLHALEQSDYLDSKALSEISDQFTWHKKKSESFCENNLPETVGDHKVCFTHHDASHFFDNVATELKSIQPLVEDTGIIILDDFNDTFSQVRAAYYHLRYTENFPFELLLTGFNKAILVHESRFDENEDFVLNGLFDELEKRHISLQLCRSDVNKFSRSFFIKELPKGETNRYYGTKFWGDKFYQPSRELMSK